MVQRSERYVTPRDGKKTRPGANTAVAPAPRDTPGAGDASLAPQLSTTTRPALTAWAELGPPFALLAAPLYRGLSVEPPTAQHWTLFTVAWGGVVDHYVPGGAGPWPPAILASLIIAAPLVNAKRPAKPDTSSSTSATTPAATTTTAPTPAPKRCAACLTYGGLEHPRQENGTEPCDCACHRRLL